MPITFEETLPSLPQLNPTFLVPLSHYSIISLSGEDQNKYLQGQVTCDVNKANLQSIQVGAHCDAKGKVFSAFRLFSRDGALLLLQPKSCLTDSIAELKKFGVFSKVDINENDELSIYALIGEQASTLLHENFTQVPDSLTPVVHSDTTTIIYLAGNLTRYLLIDTVATLTEKLNPLNITAYPAPVWDLLEISEGFPQLTAQSSREYVPQMLNLQALNGISFTKGCYLGQETVARMQYLGKNKRALFSLSANTEKPLLDNEVLEKQLGEHWRKAGDILCAYQSTDGCCYLQAVLSSDIDNTSQLRLKSQPNIKVSVQPLPYSLVAK